MEYDVFRSIRKTVHPFCFGLRMARSAVLPSLRCSQGKKNQMRFALAGTRRSAEWDSEDLQNLSIGRRDGPNLSYTKDTALVTPGAGALVSIRQDMRKDFRMHLSRGSGNSRQSAIRTVNINMQPLKTGCGKWCFATGFLKARNKTFGWKQGGVQNENWDF